MAKAVQEIDDISAATESTGAYITQQVRKVRADVESEVSPPPPPPHSLTRKDTLSLTVYVYVCNLGRAASGRSDVVPAFGHGGRRGARTYATADS